MVILVPADDLDNFKLSVRQRHRVRRRDGARATVWNVDDDDLTEMSGRAVADRPDGHERREVAREDWTNFAAINPAAAVGNIFLINLWKR